MTRMRKRPHEAGADLRWQAGDREAEYRETTGDARPVLSLAWSRPVWCDRLARSMQPTRRKPRVSWRGNVAFVRIAPLGFRLVEVEPGRWRIAFWKGREVCKASEAGSRAQADAALAELLRVVERPVYPPLPMVAVACGGVRHG